MDHDEEHDLDHIVRQRGPLPVRQAVDYLIQAARILETAHAQGIVHRDIKPGNLIVDGGNCSHPSAPTICLASQMPATSSGRPPLPT